MRGKDHRSVEASAPLLEAGRLFAGFEGSWWIAGGWAVDLEVGRVRRTHTDVDILVLARESELLARHFADRPLTVTDQQDGARRPWVPGEPPEPGRETLSLDAGGTAGPVEILFGAADGADWVFHRGRRTRRPLEALTRTSPGGLPYLSPEVVLLFKARDGRPKDDADFADLAPLLTEEQRAWLAPRLAPPGAPAHPWSARLAAH
ncbi:hypothetical protein VR45_01625 [Streptomyces sp. NRRL S-495]|nr:hypothetical protein VR45_01625 [Streptomyces sp. NRRL S-495]